MGARNRLSAGFMKKPEPGKHLDGAGLWLVVREDGGAQWVLRVTVYGRRREMGLGGFPSLSLATARTRADRWRAVAATGRDPIKEREAERRAASRADISLATITTDCFEARKAELKGDGVGSMDRCNTLSEHFSRRMKMQRFARSFVEVARDCAQLGLAEDR